jgi:hypothetical protein
MIILTDKDASGTSFHNVTIKTSLSKLKEILGDPQHECNTGEDKTNIDYICELEDGTVFTIYDWKMYRQIGEDEILHFHIGAQNAHDAFRAKNEMHGMGLFPG